MLTGRRVWEEPWPIADPALLQRDVVELVVQVNGKLRDRVEAPATAERQELEALAREPPARAGLSRRQGRRQGRRGARQAGQLRRALNGRGRRGARGSPSSDQGRTHSPADLGDGARRPARLSPRRAVLVCGGLGGVMAAACRGARAGAGMTVGLLPGDDRADANEWVVAGAAHRAGRGAQCAHRPRRRRDRRDRRRLGHAERDRARVARATPRRRRRHVGARARGVAGARRRRGDERAHGGGEALRRAGHGQEPRGS